MITFDEMELASDGKYKIAFTGLSTDTKPVGQIEGLKIANGSSFFEMDTMSVNMYDEAGERWVG